MPGWTRGHTITWRNVAEAVEYAFPAIVVTDEAGLIVLYQPHNTTAKRMRGDRGPAGGRQSSSQLAPAHWNGDYEDYTYTGPDVLRAYFDGDGYSIIRSVTSDGDISGWYINIELPWQRTPIGFDSRDLVLDVRLRNGVWAWEDEDELIWAVDNGLVSADQEKFARISAAAALDAAEHKMGAFQLDWERYLPEKDWLMPAVSHDWATVF